MLYTIREILEAQKPGFLPDSEEELEHWQATDENQYAAVLKWLENRQAMMHLDLANVAAYEAVEAGADPMSVSGFCEFCGVEFPWAALALLARVDLETGEHEPGDCAVSCRSCTMGATDEMPSDDPMILWRKPR